MRRGNQTTGKENITRGVPTDQTSAYAAKISQRREGM